MALLVDNGLIINFSDIFRLKIGDLEVLEGFAEKKSKKILKAIEDSKEIKLSNFIYALGIRHVGQETSIILVDYYNNINELMNTTKEELENLYDIGQEVSQSITKYFEDNWLKMLIKGLTDSHDDWNFDNWYN